MQRKNNPRETSVRPGEQSPEDGTPTVSVVISVAGPSGHIDTVIDRLVKQTHLPEIVVTVDGCEDLAAYLRDRYSDCPVVVDETSTKTGLSAARNRGADVASGEIVAFTDADCTPSEDWVAELVRCYQEHGAIAAGGPAAPAWPADRPARVPHELDWLVGATHRGFEPDGEGIREVRNTFGCNISFLAEVFEDLGGFDTRLGKRPGREIQGEEAELCCRLQEEYGQGVHYNPEAAVVHHIDDGQLDRKRLIKRSFWQGRSKRVLADVLPESTAEESDYLGQLLRSWVPERFGRTVSERSPRPLIEATWLLAATAAVATGYMTGGYGSGLESTTKAPNPEAMRR